MLAAALAASAALATFALASSGAGDDGVFGIALADGEITLESKELAAGRHVVEQRNEGTTEHELVLVRTDLGADELPVGLHGVSIKGAGELVVGEDHLRAGHEHQPGTVLGLLPGESRRQRVDLAPGSYVAFCQTGSHYLAGESVELEVR